MALAYHTSYGALAFVMTEYGICLNMFMHDLLQKV